MRDVEEVHTTVRRQLPRPSSVKNWGVWTYESEVSCCLSIRRISSMCGCVVLGVLKHTVFWA